MGLQPIQDLLIHKEYGSLPHLFILACKVESQIKENLRMLNDRKHENKPVFVSFSVTNNLQEVENYTKEENELIETPTPLVEKEDEEMDAPTSSEESQKGKDHGAIITQGEYVCDDLQLSTFHAILEQKLVKNNSDMHMFQVENSDCIDLSAPCEKIIELPAILSVSYDKLIPSNDHVELVRHKEVLTRISSADSLCYIMLDSPMKLSHAMEKVSEIACSKSLSSAYIPGYKFNLIEDYGVDNQFLLYRICITCDHVNELKLAVLDNNSCVLNLV